MDYLYKTFINSGAFFVGKQVFFSIIARLAAKLRKLGLSYRST